MTSNQFFFQTAHTTYLSHQKSSAIASPARCVGSTVCCFVLYELVASSEDSSVCDWLAWLLASRIYFAPPQQAGVHKFDKLR
jgi:hypothetical protein